MTTADGSTVGLAEVGMRCSQWARETGVELGGTAPPQNGYLLVEHPPPWPANASDVPALAPLRGLLDVMGIRLQLVCADGPRSPVRRLVLYRRTEPDAFDGYRRIEVDFRDDTMVLDLARQMLEQPVHTRRIVDAGPLDLLVCSHGAHDVCCGADGTRLARVAASLSTVTARGVRVWRTTHLGGHRFAPTAVTLPDGVVWGYLDDFMIDAIVLRDRPANRVTPYVRGCSGLPTGAAQVLDRALLAEQGWEWLSIRRSADAVVDGRVRIAATHHDGRHSVWDGQTVSGRELPIPRCRVPLAGTEKLERELSLAAFRAVSKNRTTDW